VRDERTAVDKLVRTLQEKSAEASKQLKVSRATCLKKLSACSVAYV
jgi:hypothetical protein